MDKAEKLGREDVWLYSEIGWNLGTLKKYEEGLKYFEKVIEMGRNDEWIYSQIGWTLAKLGRNEEAVENFKKAVELNPYDSWIEYNLGRVLRKCGKFIEAMEHIKKSAEIGGYEGWTDLELAWDYAEIDEKEIAKEYLENVEKYLDINSDAVKEDYNIVKSLINAMPVIFS